MRISRTKETLATVCYYATIVAVVAAAIFIYSGVSCTDAEVISWEEGVNRVIVGIVFLLSAIPLYSISIILFIDLAKADRKERRVKNAEIEESLERRYVNPYPEKNIPSDFRWRTSQDGNRSAIGVVNDRIVEIRFPNQPANQKVQ